VLLAVGLYTITGFGVTGFGVTVGFHRLITHRSFTASEPPPAPRSVVGTRQPL